jgi:hypothetical protein
MIVFRFQGKNSYQISLPRVPECIISIINRHQRQTQLTLSNSLKTIIEIGPYRGGWQCFEGPGVEPYWTGESAKDDAISYATGRVKFGRGEIRVLSKDGSVESVIAFDETTSRM